MSENIAFQIGDYVRITEDTGGAPVGTVVRIKDFFRLGKWTYYEYEYRKYTSLICSTATAELFEGE